MEIVFNTRTVPCSRELLRQTKLVQEHMECVVSDVNDDIGKIAWAEAQICLKSKELGSLELVAGATAEVCVYYLSEEHDKVLSMHLSRDFSVGFTCGDLPEGTEAQVLLCCQGVQARALNPRKLAIDLTVRAELGCFAGDSLVAAVSADAESGEELQLLFEQSSCAVRAQVCEKSFIVSEQLPVPQEGIIRLLSSHAELLRGDCQMIGSKALIKGISELRFGCETEEGSAPVFFEQRIPFSVLLDSGDEDCALGALILQPTALYAELSDAINGGRVIELELHAAAQGEFTKTVALDHIVDAYSTTCPLRCTQSTATVGCSGEGVCFTSEARDEISLEDEAVTLQAKQAQLLSFSAKENAAFASAVVSLLLQNADGSYGTVQKLLSFEAPLPAADCRIDEVRLGELSVHPSGGKIELCAEAEFCGTRNRSAELRWISSVELDTENAYDLAALSALTVVTRRGRSLWELAKRYHSSPEAIEKLNAKHPMGGDQLLIARVQPGR